ncbi:MAG: hydrogenase iron-sulfur subunit [Alphaproteobacteria bacterium]|nr:hydrogenase iron-sulfur subunit [Rhodospirillales bacterium]MCW9044962.1 hydrogenase iron-sulfur subunit [Alphaproteobacteria bacterium]
MYFEGLLDAIFGQRFNPVYHLGALCWFFYWIVSITGIYLFLVFDTGVNVVYDSIEWLTHDQWWLGGIARSLHRYASDAMVFAMLIHMLREFALDRYHGVRWFAWFTGVPIIWLLLTSGITGYWLVWDELAQYMAIASFEWLDWLSIFSEPIANNFLREGSLGDRFFTLLIFIHIFVPLALLFVMWIHLLRMARAEINPPKAIAWGAFGLLMVLSLVFPAVSHPPADLSKVPVVLNLDWWYLFVYPALDWMGAGAMWATAIIFSVVLSIMPFIIPHRAPTPAVVNLDNCNGCGRCFEDCPFGAVTMQPRTDGHPSYEFEAIVKESFCTACGTCSGACPSSSPYRRGEELITGIDLPDVPLTAVRARLNAEAKRLTGDVKIVVFGCEFGGALKELESDVVGTVQMSCIAQVPPAFIEYALSRAGFDGLVLSACRPGDCYHRLGVHWTEERLTGYRDPYLRPKIPRDAIRVSWARPTEMGKIRRELGEFVQDVTNSKKKLTHDSRVELESVAGE